MASKRRRMKKVSWHALVHWAQTFLTTIHFSNYGTWSKGWINNRKWDHLRYYFCKKFRLKLMRSFSKSAETWSKSFFGSYKLQVDHTIFCTARLLNVSRLWHYIIRTNKHSEIKKIMKIKSWNTQGSLGNYPKFVTNMLMPSSFILKKKFSPQACSSQY